MTRIEHITEGELNLPPTLRDRLEVQRGSNKCDLSLCRLNKVPLSAINEHFGRPEKMELDLSFNFLTYLSPYFGPVLSHVVKLDLSRNRIKKLPDNFGELSGLVHLDIHENMLETLPISMGNMWQLTYLNLSDNPFRSPLKEILATVGSDVSGNSVAEMVVIFLQEIAQGLEVMPLHVNRFPYRSRPSRLRRRRRRRKDVSDSDVAWEDITDENSSDNTESSYSSSDIGTFEIRERKPSIFKRIAAIIGKTLLVALVLCILGPFFVACVADTLYLENLARNHPTFRNIWEDYNYKAVHKFVLPLAEMLPRESAWPLQLKGPPTSSRGPKSFLNKTLGLAYEAWVIVWIPFWYTINAVGRMGKYVGLWNYSGK